MNRVSNIYRQTGGEGRGMTVVTWKSEGGSAVLVVLLGRSACVMYLAILLR